MHDLDGLTDALADFAHTLTSGYHISDVLHDLTRRVSRVVGVSGAGVSLRTEGTLHFVIADAESIAELERVQDRVGVGPAFEAVRTGEPVVVTRLEQAADRDDWEQYVAAARRSGIAAVAAVPMRTPTRVGVLDLYDTKAREWTSSEIAVTQVFTDIAAAYVLHASELNRERRTVEQLQQALESRVVIEQAKGILAAERGVTVDRAFAVLRKHANDRNASLREVAEAVVRLGLRP